MTQNLPRCIGVLGGAAITVGVMIGSGIFRTPTYIANEMGSPTLILAMWAAGGLLCLLGAFTFAELATMFPQSGGVYVFLREGFGPVAAFVFGWTYFLISQPMAIAAISIVFAEHLSQLLISQGFVSGPLHPRSIIAITCALIIILTGVNVTGMKRGAGLAIALTGTKTLALAAIVGLAICLSTGNANHFSGIAAPKPIFSSMVPVLTAVFWTYDGWSNSAAFAEEIQEPQKKIPKILLLGTGLMTALYLAVNTVYLWIIPLNEMRQTDTLAPLVMERLVGPAGATVVTLMVMITVLGSAHASIIVGSRVTFAQARDRLLFAFQGKLHPKYSTPATALWVQALLACLATMILRDFSSLMGGFVFSIWIFYGLSAAVIFILRVRKPNARRPFRCWGYPVVPAVFVAVATLMTTVNIWNRPRHTLPWLAILLAGVPAYFFWKRMTRINGE